MSTCSQGSQARMALDADSTFDASSTRTDFVYETLQKHGRLVGSQGIAGTRSRTVERKRVGAYEVGGRLAFEPGPYLLDFLLPRILGGTKSDGSIPLAEGLPSMSVLIDKVGSIFRYDSCYVDRAVFRAKAGPGDSDSELVELILEVVAKTETGGATWASTIPALDVTAANMPYVLSDAILTIVSPATYQFKQFALTVDNFLQTRWVNSLTATAICPRDRRVLLMVENPFSASEYAAFYSNVSQSTGVAGSLAFTNGTVSTTFTLPCLAWADETPVVRGKTEIPYWIAFECLKTGSTAEVVVANDSTV